MSIIEKEPAQDAGVIDNLIEDIGQAEDRNSLKYENLVSQMITICRQADSTTQKYLADSPHPEIHRLLVTHQTNLDPEIQIQFAETGPEAVRIALIDNQIEIVPEAQTHLAKLAGNQNIRESLRNNDHKLTPETKDHIKTIYKRLVRRRHLGI